MTKVEFEEPPPPRSGPRTDPVEMHTAKALREHAGQWAVVGTYTTHYEAQLTERRVRRGSPGTPWAAGFEVAVRKVEPQVWKVYARYVGRDTTEASA
jgi:hypothetical protein